MSYTHADALDRLGDDRRLELDRAKALDPQTWASWHDEHYALIYRYAYARLNSEEEAKDIASQTFLEAMRSIHRYSDRGKPILAWFYGIAHHLVSRRRRELAKLAAEQDQAERADEQPSTEDSVVLGIEVRSALERLKPEQRDVLLLRFALGLPTRQVAQLLGKSEAATYSLQVRAAAALRKLLST